MFKQLLENSYLFGGNAPFVEQLYENWLENPASVPEEWRGYFDKLQLLPGALAKDVAHAPVVESFAQRARAKMQVNIATGMPRARCTMPE